MLWASICGASSLLSETANHSVMNTTVLIGLLFVALYVAGAYGMEVENATIQGRDAEWVVRALWPLLFLIFLSLALVSMVVVAVAKAGRLVNSDWLR